MFLSPSHADSVPAYGSANVVTSLMRSSTEPSSLCNINGSNQLAFPFECYHSASRSKTKSSLFPIVHKPKVHTRRITLNSTIIRFTDSGYVRIDMMLPHEGACCYSRVMLPWTDCHRTERLQQMAS
jgi:hypothetical protein